MKKSISFFIIFLSTLFSKSLAQNPPISPRWVFEPWVWEDQHNTKTYTLNLINGYQDYDIPVGAIIIDSPWEAQIDGTYNETSNNGYNTFIFDQNRYDQSGQFIQGLRDKNIHVILWITGVIDKGCLLYQEAKDNNYFVNNGAITSWWKGSGQASHIDFFNPAAVAYWESLMDNVLDNYEVEGWKVDESDYYLKGTRTITTASGNKTPAEYSDAYYSEMYNYIYRKLGNNGMITARPYCSQSGDNPYWFAPISANTAGWVGDADNSWSGLRLSLNNIFISANAGYAAVGSDIGGYLNNNTSDRTLFLRWTQLGALMPIMENGGQKDNCHQPWLFSPVQSTTDIYRYYATLHHELVPYLYSYDIAAHSTKTSIIRPFGTRGSYPGSPTDSSSWNNYPRNEYDYSYLLGDNLFVSAIARVEDNSTKSVVFPPGSWINYWNENNIHQGGTTVPLNYSIEEYPLFIRSGAIIPMNVDNSVTGHGSGSSQNYLTLLVYPDDLTSHKYYTAQSNFTIISCDEHQGGYTINFSKNTGHVIIRLKNNIEPESIKLNDNISLVEKNSFSEFESSSSGRFYGKLNSNENVYTWIKFTDPANTVNIRTTSCALNLSPDNYAISNLNEGNEYYIDRDFTLTNVPDEFKGLTMIKTANDDKAVSNLGFHFNICSSADIYIAYDYRLTPPPSWLTDDYLITGEVISVSDGYGGHLDVWKSKQTIQPGIINLGDNNGNTNSSMYFVFYKTYETSYLNARAFLQGPYTGSGTMLTLLSRLDLTSSPYTEAPKTVSYTVPDSVTDWVLLQFRSTSNGTAIASKSCFLSNHGYVIDPNGFSTNISLGIPPASYYIVVKHRNHLAVMSSDLVELDGITSYDFTTSESQAYIKTVGAIPMANLGGTPTKYGMYDGDTDASGVVDVLDRANAWNNRNHTGVYVGSDTDLSSVVDVIDRANTWNNRNIISQVP